MRILRKNVIRLTELMKRKTGELTSFHRSALGGSLAMNIELLFYKNTKDLLYKSRTWYKNQRSIVCYNANKLKIQA